jgi:amidase
VVTGTDATWIERFVPGPLMGEGPGSLVAVKDLIDVAGSVTTAGCKAVADTALPAEKDAECVARLRQAGVRLAGKVNLHELAYGVTGVNPWFGTPPNPSDEGRIPGGSSSGSAVAVARGEVDWALGTDTGGSVRIPAACCGIVGLKTTHGRIPLEGVWPLAPRFDTVGPLAKDVAGIAVAMAELEGGFVPEPVGGFVIGRLRVRLEPALEMDPVIEAAVDEALRRSELGSEDLALPGWFEAWEQQQLLLGDEAFAKDSWLLEDGRAAGLGEDVRRRLADSRIDRAVVARAEEVRVNFSALVDDHLSRFSALALPTLPFRPFRPGERRPGFNSLTAPVNLTGLPAITVPVPASGRPPTGLQIIGRRGSEERLVTIASVIEEAVAA